MAKKKTSNCIEFDKLQYDLHDKMFFRIMRNKLNGACVIQTPIVEGFSLATFTIDKKLAKDIAKFITTGVKPKK